MEGRDLVNVQGVDIRAIVWELEKKFEDVGVGIQCGHMDGGASDAGVVVVSSSTSLVKESDKAAAWIAKRIFARKKRKEIGQLNSNLPHVKLISIRNILANLD